MYVYIPMKLPRNQNVCHLQKFSLHYLKKGTITCKHIVYLLSFPVLKFIHVVMCVDISFSFISE